MTLRPVSADDFDFLWTWRHATPDAEWKLWDGPYFEAPANPSREEFDQRQRAGLGSHDRRIIELDLIFDETDAHVVTLQTWAGNERMSASARRCGFVECGRIPEARSWNGRRWDSVKMCALRPRPSLWECRIDTQLPDDVARLLATVPEWFGLEEANQEYIDAARHMETWSVRDEHGRIIGVTLVDRDFPISADIHLMVVDRAWHGQGVGSAMLRAVASASRADGVRLLQVKTLGPSHPDAGYARTRHFYEKCGFLPLEETDLWGDDNPCLFMVMPL